MLCGIRFFFKANIVFSDLIMMFDYIYALLFNPDRFKMKSNRKIMSRTPEMIVVLSVLLAVLTAPLSGCAVNPASGRSELALISMSADEEKALGQKMFPVVLQKMGGEYPDPELQDYVQSVGDRLKNAGYRKDVSYSFRVANDSAPNAFALPGGYIAITRGLLSSLANEGQLAAVLGHEIGHVDARHALQGLQWSNLLGLGLTSLPGMTDSARYSALIRSSGEVSTILIEHSYSREQERESDRFAIDYMIRTGYNPVDAVDLQQVFVRKIDKPEDPQWLDGLFRTHPFSKKRLEETREYIAENYPEANRTDRKPDQEFLIATEKMRKAIPGYKKYDQALLIEKEKSSARAIGLYLEAAALAPEESLILTGLGLAYLRLEDFVSAKQHLSRAVRIDGSYYLSRLGLAYVYLDREGFSKAILHAEKSFELFPTVESVYLAARGYDGSDESGKALQRYQVVAQSVPNSSMAKLSVKRIREIEGTK